MKKLFLVLAVTGLVASLGCAKAVYTVSCGESIKSLKITKTAFTVVCPANCTVGSVWGTDMYTTDSSLCPAAIHAGVIGKEGGTFKVAVVPGMPAYKGSVKNGVKSSGWGAFDKSFVVSK